MILEHVGVVVLRDRSLLAAVTDFQRGLSLVVQVFFRKHASALLPALLLRDARLATDPSCVLANVAVLAGDERVLRLLFALSRRPQSPLSRDRRVSFASAARCAVLFARVEALEWLAQLTARDSRWQWEPGLLRLALRRPTDTNVPVLEWIFTNLPAERSSLRPNDVSVLARSGDLDAVRWLHERGGCEITRVAVDAAVHGRRLHVLRYLYEHSSQRCSRAVVDDAAMNGYLEIVKLIVENAEDDGDSSCRGALGCAARGGHLESVRWLLESGIDHDVQNLFDHVAGSGHVAVLECLHAHFRESRDDVCTTAAMDAAAGKGFLDVVQFLHEHRTEGCTTAAMDMAARNGHVEVLQFLHENRSEGCTVGAMNSAAKQLRLDIVAFLHVNRTEGCTAEALEFAVSEYHWGMIRYLCIHRPESNIEAAMVNVALRRLGSDFAVLKALLERRRPDPPWRNC
ncbi:hypothetical protein PybrP1_006849, partial [[Pythium] brassicae (nom. inval.)]